jgi:hypothetical protein
MLYVLDRNLHGDILATDVHVRGMQARPGSPQVDMSDAANLSSKMVFLLFLPLWASARSVGLGSRPCRSRRLHQSGNRFGSLSALRSTYLRGYRDAACSFRDLFRVRLGGWGLVPLLKEPNTALGNQCVLWYTSWR